MTSIIDGSLCSNCGRCSKVCRQDCIYPAAQHYIIRQYDCIDCGACREACSTGAAQIDG